MTSTNNSNNNSSSSNSRQRNNTNVKKEGISKLSNDKALAEAILIGKKPYLAVVDFSNPDNVRIVLMESLAYSSDIRLVPELVNKRPYSFKDKEEFFTTIERAKNETLDSLFDKSLFQWKRYINADDFHLKICAADTIYTYFQDRIGSTHYLFFIADNDAGKTNNLKLLNILAYRNLMNTSMTHANIYNFLGSKDEGIGTICIDEADNIDQYPLMMEILKSGYSTGIPVTRIIDTVQGRRQVSFNTYCFKAMAGERLPDEVEARGFMQRTIVIKCFPGFVKDDISEVTDPAGDNEYEHLLNELNDLKNLLFCYRFVHFNDKIPNINLNIRNREKQLFKPLLRLFQGTNTFDTLRPVISKYINERRESKANSFHAFLYRILRDLIKSQGLELDFINIWNFIKMNVEWKDALYRPQSIETVEFGVISQKQVGLTLKNVFGGQPPKHKGSTRRLVFKQDVMDRMKDSYETVDVNVGLETSESLDNHTRFEFGADGAGGAGCGSMDIPQNDTDEHKNHEEKAEIDTSPYPENVPQVPQVPQSESTNDKSTKKYSDYLVDGVPIWEKENRMWTKEEAEAYNEEINRLRDLQ